MDKQQVVVGGVDTHKDLHVAAVVDEQDRVLGSECFPSTRQGHKRMLLWMRSFGELSRVGIECTGTYGAGLLRYLQQGGVTALEVTTPDKCDRRKRGKDDTVDAEEVDHVPRTHPIQAHRAADHSSLCRWHRHWFAIPWRRGQSRFVR